MPLLTYMPHHYDPDETSVDGVTFRAYEPVEVSDKPGLVNKLAHNPWFSDGAIDVERKLEWEKVRSAQKAAADDLAAAEKAAADPAAEAFRATAYIDRFRTPPAGEAIIVEPPTAVPKSEAPAAEVQAELDTQAKPKNKSKKDKE